MTCPECKHKITSKHYDPEMEWYECPGCEGCFTPDELEAARPSKNPIVKGLKKAESKVKAKGKVRQSEILEDEEAVAAFESEMLKPVKASAGETKHRDELPTREVVSIMADELQEIYREMGGSLNDVNARDKALTLWREVHYKDGVHAREKAVEHVLCGAHS